MTAVQPEEARGGERQPSVCPVLLGATDSTGANAGLPHTGGWAHHPALSLLFPGFPAPTPKHSVWVLILGSFFSAATNSSSACLLILPPLPVSLPGCPPFGGL